MFRVSISVVCSSSVLLYFQLKQPLQNLLPASYLFNTVIYHSIHEPEQCLFVYTHMSNWPIRLRFAPGNVPFFFSQSGICISYAKAFVHLHLVLLFISSLPYDSFIEI